MAMIKKAITVTFLFIQFIIVSLLLFAEGSTDYYLKRGQLYSNAVYVIAGLVITALLCFALWKKKTELKEFLSKYLRTVVALTVILFFVLSLLVCIGGLGSGGYTLRCIRSSARTSRRYRSDLFFQSSE